jgi:thiamine pyrophosphate-dependent acetolactate synthase large subunit-like protein
LNVLLFDASDEVAPGRVRVADRRHRHVREILRAKLGDGLAVGRIGGMLGRGTLVALDAHALELEVTLERQPPPPLPVTLALALPRPPSLRKVLQQATAMGVKRFVLFASARVEKSWNRQPNSMPRVTAELRRGLPDNVVIVDESITASLDLARAFDYRGFGDYFGGRGGGIGQGLAGAIGVKVAMPDRPVVAVSGDGSAMYAIQALWTAAHHQLAIVFVVLANREYRILKHNVDVWRKNFEAGTQHPYQQMDLTGPELDFVHLAAGMGVEGVRVERSDAIAPALAKAVAANRPYLVEIAIEGKR